MPLRKILVLATAAVCLLPIVSLAEKNEILARIQFEGASGEEKTAGVWVDGQYVGFVKELKHEKKLLLLPGKHEIVVKQAWYTEHRQEVMLTEYPCPVFASRSEMHRSCSLSKRLPKSSLIGESFSVTKSIIKSERLAGSRLW